MDLLEHIKYASRQVESLNAVRKAIGEALTPEQQMAVSAKVAGGPDKFIAWAGTLEGRDMVRMLADEFVASGD
jgi:hypothetical protein